ncbi:MAG: trypsin-like peptidase domain-containing protein [Microcystis sp. LE19-338.1B]|nr:trypsin-like peptidase domain-containing protein [Microcystis sp. LE19-338.1B]MCZ8360853.1 trypsin-like peptidase domain-containing protein [Microcystis sp. LE19-388.1G]
MTHNIFNDNISPRNEGNPKRSKSSAMKKLFAYSSLLVLGAGLGIGATYAYSQNPLELAQNIATAANNPRPSTAAAAAPSSLVIPTNFVASVVQEVGPAVVRINASREVNGGGDFSEFANDPVFRRFFGSQIPARGEKQVQRGTGSGFIISNDGKIITNAHVVEGADKVTVTLKDGRTIDGKVLGSDPLTDVAVVQVETSNLPTVKLGNSDSLQVGEWAIAIGNPLGLDNTVTTGIISAKERNSSQIGASDKRVDFLQTDAAINPGNSGGPLLNDRGEVIGVNTAIIQNAQGLGFAIPIKTAQRIAEQLIATGKVEHPYLGVQMVQLTPEVKEQLADSPMADNWTIPDDSGVLLVRVMRDSPAAAAGLRSGDVLKSVGGKNVTDPDAVQEIVANTQIGDNLPVEISRQGQKINLNIQVGSLNTANKS